MRYLIFIIAEYLIAICFLGIQNISRDKAILFCRFDSFSVIYG